MRIMLTPELAYASGFDAGNASMRKAGRMAWNCSDANIAALKTNRLLAELGTPALKRLLKKQGMI